MKCNSTSLSVLAGLILLPSLPARAADKAVPAQGSYEQHLKPFLAEHCYSCHGKEKQKGKVNLQVREEKPSIVADPQFWEKVALALKSKDMPPEDETQPSEADRTRIVQFIEAELAQFDCKTAVNPGKVTLRRLNRAEYNNTIRDLLGVDFKPAANFPSDEVGYGFDNIGDVLSLPPLLMEKYLAAAEEIVTRALVTETPNLAVKRFGPAQLKNTSGDGAPLDDQAWAFYREGEASLEFEASAAGTYALKISAYGEQAGPDPARMSVRLAGKELQVLEVKSELPQPETFELSVPLQPGKHRFSFAYLNNFNGQNNPDAKQRGDRNLFLRSVTFTSPQGAMPKLPGSHTRLIPHPALPGQEREYARQILTRFTRQAYRRAVTPAEVDRLLKFVDQVRAEQGNFEEGIQLAVQAVLTSPHFLFRWELDSKGAETKPAILPLNDYELANRLSYFLWSSMPDEELFALAEKGLLHQEKVLHGQVDRMLKHKNAQALVENFAGQWLQTRNLAGVAPDPKLFPEFDDKLRLAMRQETELFFSAILQEDRSVKDFINADFTFLNERLAKHYGINGIEGEGFQRVALNGKSQRGGILTQASVLTITSNPTRTSPVQRGKWIMEQVLGSPPPPPPPDVPELETDAKAMDAASLRQRLEKHRSKPECASCHNKMDPLGFAFENFDAIGRWRDSDGKFPVNSSGTLPSGQSFNGPNELKAILQQQETFVRFLSQKMLTYALGRGLEYYDKCAVDDIYAATVGDKYKFSALIHAVIKSDPFLKKGEKEL